MFKKSALLSDIMVSLGQVVKGLGLLIALLGLLQLIAAYTRSSGLVLTFDFLGIGAPMTALLILVIGVIIYAVGRVL